MEILGYLGALCIGLVLGLTGGGGSILTVPILVYLMSISPVTATAYSLFIVGTTSTFGAIHNYRKNLVDIKNGFIFAIPSCTYRLTEPGAMSSASAVSLTLSCCR